MASGLYSLAGKLVGELCSPIFEDYVGKPWRLGKKREFQKLEKTLSALKAVLLDAEDQQETNYQIRDWLTKIKVVFYDVEDLLQEVTTKALRWQVMTKNKRAKEVRIFFSSSNQLKDRFNMGFKVKLIRESLDAIASDRKNFKLAERSEEMHVMSSRFKRRDETHSFVPKDKFIGRNKDKRDVTSLLLESDCVDNVSVISIIGIGGLGKTTLAQSVYSSDEVKGNFEVMIWVCVSDTFDVKLICQKIIESSTRKTCERRLQMDVVKDELKKAVDGKKYLLVLDDMWNECPQKWMNLEVLLTGGAQGSKILITARAEIVARTSKSIATHVLKELSREESWELFEQVAFKGWVEPKSSTVVRIGKEVAQRCVGVPLAIKTIGSMLGLKERETDWVNFKKKVHLRIAQDSKHVINLKLSYDYLSAPLKRCFAYCAIFPKDRVIEKETLIRMWMAHGLIQLDRPTSSLEDVGEQYFMDLMDRSLFEPYRKNNDGTILSFKMHDLIHDLALFVGGDEEFWSSGSDVDCNDVRHAWVTHHPCISTNLLHAKKLRTLVVKNSSDTPNNDDIIGEFKQIRVLVFRYPGRDRAPDFLGGLSFLSYLDLSGYKFEILPESLCSLYNLQTLKLFQCINLKELPTGTRNLVSLRHLEIRFCNELSHMPSGLGELTSLRTLTDFVMGEEGSNCSELGELKSLVKLRGQIRIRNLRRATKVSKCIRNGESCYPCAQLEFIQGLDLQWRYEKEEEDDDEEGEEEEADVLESLRPHPNVKSLDLRNYGGKRFPSWMKRDNIGEEEADVLESLKPHPNVKSLDLRNYGGKRFPSWMERDNIGDSLPNIVSIGLYSCKGWRHFAPLGLLPSLRELKVQDMCDGQYIYEEWNNHNNNKYFPVLEKLELDNCPYLVTDGRQFSGLSNLRELRFKGYLETLPGWVPSLPHLQILEVSSCKNMVTLPEWMGNLKSLQEIRLEFCESLKSIPVCVKHLTSLQRLNILHCPKLYRRYNMESGVDWDKISHIPFILVKK